MATFLLDFNSNENIMGKSSAKLNRISISNQWKHIKVFQEEWECLVHKVIYNWIEAIVRI